MDKLCLGVEIRDFDLERVGFSLSVLDAAKEELRSQAYLQMTLSELNAFVNALKAAPEDIDLSAVERVGSRAGQAPTAADRDESPHSLQERIEADFSVRATDLRSAARGRAA